MLYIIFAFLSQIAFADDVHTQKALEQTQELLRNRDQRNAALQNDPQAKKFDQSLNKLGPVKEQLYDIAAEMMALIVRESNGDPEKMQKMLLEYQSNPAAFYSKMNPEQRQRVRDLASEVEPQQKGVRAGAH